ncbi:cytidylyltransferase domain-containing protein [Bacteroides pyogenes]|uniref:cytidylyltransferase domain-containing protein n=1 Tax=Bacteroides pyogenes TaxID=310300 RepID=UPI003B42EF01
MKVLAITQARYGSTRFPAKVLKEINGETLLELHLKRILQASKVTKLKVATTTEEGVDKIVEIAHRIGVETYKGSVDDVLERFYFTAKDEQPDYVVRVTSDCPLIDPKEIDNVITACIEGDLDYASNTLTPTFPDGVDCECFKFAALEKAYNEATLKSEREHVTPYIKKNSTEKGGNLFKSLNVVNDENYSEYRITVDTQEDFDLIKNLIINVGTDRGWKDYIEYLKQHKEVYELNNMHARDEGYAKSIANDSVVK